MDLVLVGAVVTGAVTLILMITLAATAGSRGDRTRLRNLTSPGSPRAASEVQAGRQDSMPTVSKVLRGWQLTEWLYMELTAAGMTLRPSEFIGIVAGCVIVFALIGLFSVPGAAGLVIFALIGASIPIIVLKVRQAQRRAAFNAQIVDAIVMISSSLRSGFAFLRAMQMVSREMSPPIATEFERAISEMNVGRPLDDALKGIVARTKSYDFDLVATAVFIQHQVGGNLADILDTIASTIRERMRIMGEMRALTAEGRISGVVLVALPIVLAIALFVINRTYIQILFTETIGHYLIGGAVVAQVIGGLVVRKMLAVDI